MSFLKKTYKKAAKDVSHIAHEAKAVEKKGMSEINKKVIVPVKNLPAQTKEGISRNIINPVTENANKIADKVKALPSEASRGINDTIINPIKTAEKSTERAVQHAGNSIKKAGETATGEIVRVEKKAVRGVKNAANKTAQGLEKGYNETRKGINKAIKGTEGVFDKFGDFFKGIPGELLKYLVVAGGVVIIGGVVYVYASSRAQAKQ